MEVYEIALHTLSVSLALVALLLISRKKPAKLELEKPDKKTKVLITPSGSFEIEDENGKRNAVYNDDDYLWTSENSQ